MASGLYAAPSCGGSRRDPAKAGTERSIEGDRGTESGGEK